MISVICVAYNAEKYIVEAIDSVFSQTYKDLEVIVVDDCSTDSTVLLLNKYNSFSNFKLIKSKHTGNPGKLRNEAIRQSRYDIIAFIDADDIWTPIRLEKQIRYINSYEMVCSNAERIYEKNIVFDSIFFGASNFFSKSKKNIIAPKTVITVFTHDEDIDLKKLLFMNCVVTSSVLISKGALFAAGSFEEDLGKRGEDYLLWLNIAKRGKIRFLNESLVMYRIHSENLSLSSFNERIELLERTLLIRSKYFNEDDPLVVKAAKSGCVAIFYELTKLHLIEGKNKKAMENWYYLLKSFENKFSFRWLKYLLIYVYISVLYLFSGGKQ